MFFFGDRENQENKRESGGDREINWNFAIQQLISEGHRIESIKKYTPYQLINFFKSVEKKKKEDFKNNILSHALANQDGKEINKVIKDLERD